MSEIIENEVMDMFSGMFEITKSDDIWTPTVAKPREGVVLTPISDWVDGATYSRSGGGDYTERERTVRAEFGKDTLYVFEIRLWHGGFNSGSEFTDYCLPN